MKTDPILFLLIREKVRNSKKFNIDKNDYWSGEIVLWEKTEEKHLEWWEKSRRIVINTL